MIVVTLAHPGGVPSTLVDAASAALGGAAWSWLDAGLAVDLRCGLEAEAARAALRPFEAHVDVIVQREAERARRLLVADMDSTMIDVECIDELARYAGVVEQVAEITARAMRGELDFAGALKARVALLTGLPDATIAQCLAERVRPAAGAATLTATLKARGVRTVLVTGGFTGFAGPVAAQLGFDAVHANRLEVAGGRLTGRVRDPILGGEAKRQTLLAETRALSVGPEWSLAIGDGANDVAMFRAAGLGIAVHGKPAAREAAGARIAHGDLTTVLWAMGVGKADWLNRD